jgi:hypothetical protein
MSLEKREEIQVEIERMRGRTGIPVTVLVGYAEVSRSTWQEWQTRRFWRRIGGGGRRSTTGTCPSITGCPPPPPSEQEAIIAYCRERLQEGYRQLTCPMPGANIVAVSCSAACSAPRRADLMKRKNGRKRAGKPEKGLFSP